MKLGGWLHDSRMCNNIARIWFEEARNLVPKAPRSRRRKRRGRWEWAGGMTLHLSVTVYFVHELWRRVGDLDLPQDLKTVSYTVLRAQWSNCTQT